MKKGNLFQGGIVLAVDLDGKGGLMMAVKDMPLCPNKPQGNYAQAIDRLKSFVSGGYNDWRLPTCDPIEMTEAEKRELKLGKNRKYYKVGGELALLSDMYGICEFNKATPTYLSSTVSDEKSLGGITFYEHWCTNPQIRIAVSVSESMSGCVVRPVRRFRVGELGTLAEPVGMLGERYNGGYIADLDSTGQHGFVVLDQFDKTRTTKQRAEEICSDKGCRLPTIEELLKINDMRMKYWYEKMSPHPYWIEGVFWSSTPGDYPNSFRDAIFNKMGLIQEQTTYGTNLNFIAVKSF